MLRADAKSSKMKVKIMPLDRQPSEVSVTSESVDTRKWKPDWMVLWRERE